MNYKIENDRVYSVIANDSCQNPEKVKEYLEAEIEYVSSAYLNICGKVKLRYRLTEDGIIFFAEIHASSVKPMFKF